jgi:hypothetical protein
MYEPKILKKANSFLGERLQIACDTIVDITQAVTESFQPLEKHVPGLVPKFVGGQKQLFNKRMNARARLLVQGR